MYHYDWANNNYYLHQAKKYRNYNKINSSLRGKRPLSGSLIVNLLVCSQQNSPRLQRVAQYVKLINNYVKLVNHNKTCIIVCTPNKTEHEDWI